MICPPEWIGWFVNGLKPLPPFRVEVERSGTGGRIWRRCRFRCRWSVAQAAVRTDSVVMPSPCFDQHLGFWLAQRNLALCRSMLA